MKMTKKILLLLPMVIMSVFAAVPDDDSIPYYPYPVQPPQEQQTQTPQTTPKKTQPKKKPVRKKQAVKKNRTKKSSSASKRPASVRKSSLQLGIELMQQERYEQAKPYLLRAIQQNRNDPNAWYWYGVYHEKTGGFYQAQYFYSKAVTIDPAFEPLSRVVFYPEDPEKTPLWDPKRPARVYPVETAPTAMNISRFPNAPNDPEMPKVPVYTPPEPGASPLDGDSWNPAVYVPPAPEELPELDGQSPVYLPPDAEAINAGESTVYEDIRKIPYTAEAYDSGQIITDREKIMRVDKPLYNPPEPGQRVVQTPQSQKSQQPDKAIKTQTKPDTKKRASVPASRVVRQSQKKSQTVTAKTPAKSSRRSRTQPSGRTASQDIRPQQRRQTQSERTRPQTQVQPETPQTLPERTQPSVIQEQQETVQPRRQTEYLPPVGQYAPDPGTISDRPIPPVGQGN